LKLRINNVSKNVDLLIGETLLDCFNYSNCDS